MNRTLAIVLRQLYLMRGSFSRIMPIFVWGVIDMVVWGFITRYFGTLASGFNFVTTILGAVLLWDFFGRVMHGTSIAFFEDVWSRNFLNVFSSPITITEYVSGLVLTSVLTSMCTLVVMLVMATTLFGLSYFVYGLMLVPFVLILFVSGIAMGIVGNAIVLRYGPATEWFIWPIPAFLSPFIGVYYPLSILPKWMQVVGHILPPSYVFEGMRAILNGKPFAGITLLYGALIALVFLLLAGHFFTRTYRHALRTGLIARYSAENVS